MIAVDTNVVVRLLTADDRKQFAAARALFASEAIWISRTVLLESAWVLMRLYRLSETEVCDGLRLLLRLPNVESEDKGTTLQVLRLIEAGLELADAMHLMSRPNGATFASFDRNFVQRARRAGLTDVLSVPPASDQRD